MKATGIVRKIDDLGRVVIPKEIRRTLRIREGDPLEIYTDTNGRVIFRKYSPIEELAQVALDYTEVLSEVSGMPVLISDRDYVIAASGLPKKEYMERRVTLELEELMESRKSFSWDNEDLKTLYPFEGINRKALIMYPIIVNNSANGSIIMLENEIGLTSDTSDDKLLKTAAAFLEKLMQ